MAGLREEEDSTTRLIDAFYVARHYGWNVTIRKHKRRLESKKNGADLRLAFQLSNGRWVNLILQAKRLYENGAYEGWKQSQLEQLCLYASSSDAGEDCTPAPLIYNGPYGDRRLFESSQQETL